MLDLSREFGWKQRMTSSHVAVALQLPSLLSASSIECVIIVIAIGSLVKNLLTQWETAEENQLNQLIKNFLAPWGS